MTKPLISFVTLLLFSTNALTNETTAVELKEYDVEIIIFEDAHARYLNSQTWGMELDNTNTVVQTEPEIIENLDQLSVDEIKGFDFQAKTPSFLVPDYKRINNSSEYNVLLFGAWRQAGLNEDRAIDINLSELSNNHPTKSESRLNGKLKLILTRYLHLYAELDYQRKITVQMVAETSLAEANSEQDSKTSEEMSAASETLQTIEKDVSFPVHFHRRMRSKELHYIDHPLVGVIVQINPVDKPKKAVN